VTGGKGRAWFLGENFLLAQGTAPSQGISIILIGVEAVNFETLFSSSSMSSLASQRFVLLLLPLPASLDYHHSLIFRCPDPVGSKQTTKQANQRNGGAKKSRRPKKRSQEPVASKKIHFFRS